MLDAVVGGPSWKVGHRDFEIDARPQALLFVTLRKSPSTKLEHRHADRFLSPTELQWESQASTKPESKKARHTQLPLWGRNVGCGPAVRARHRRVDEIRDSGYKAKLMVPRLAEREGSRRGPG